MREAAGADSAGQRQQPATGASMPYVGVASFLKLPLMTPEQAAGLDFAVLGIPFDEGTSNRPGARFGPRAIRSASTLYSYEGGAELFDVELGRSILAGARVADVGDVRIQPMAAEYNREAITRAINSILAAGALPISLGGDHSITASILAAYRSTRLPRLLSGAPASESVAPFLVHFDTHMDFDSYMPRYTHGTPVRVALDEGLVSGVLQLGVRGLNNSREDWEEAVRRGVQVVTAADLVSGVPTEAAQLVPQGLPVYVSLDMDVFDPGIAPGTGTPEPGGLSYRDITTLLRAVCRRGPVVGIDLVELSPPFDQGDMTAILAARVLLDLMGAVWEERDRALGMPA